MQERRKSFRRDLASYATLRRLDATEHEDIEIEIVDVSRTGLGFICDTPLEIGAIYQSELQIWTKEIINAFMQITRMQVKDGVLEYGAFFLGMPESVTARIDVFNTVESTVKEMDQLAQTEIPQ